ncbi:hypothetical protein [Motiliproteus sediminis]|uniref:hypothetical protein n=1 Tax=Motiliproteus sediminis TaxID=1468178 RepID=UPI001AF0132D|nr:hypothetical protein [Motiliproteus sediminis]
MIDYLILPEHRLIVVTNRDLVSIDDITRMRQRLHADSNYSPSYDVLNDSSRLNSQYSADEIFEFDASELPPIKVAIVAPSDLNFGVARMWQQLTEDHRKAQVGVFRSSGEALVWLGRPVSLAVMLNKQYGCQD